MTAVMLSHESIDYGTPAHIAELARACMGGIDLDPASSEFFNRTIRASRYITKEQNGLRFNWRGRIWLNPPYSKTNGKSNQQIWAAHLARQYHWGNTDQACLLIRAALGYNWFEDLWREYPTCVLRQRLCFVKPDGTTDGQAKYANAVVYFGKHCGSFYQTFSPFGRILLP
jgi:ParB family transcriptional regulator, chromosome partitioning protein